MRNILGLFILALVTSTSYANTTAEDFQKSKDYVKSLHGATSSAMGQFNPETTFKDYNKSAPQASYYQGVESEHMDLSDKAKAALKDDAGGQVVVAHFGSHQFDVNTKSAAIQNAKLIEEQSHALTHGQSNEKVDCDEVPKACEIKTHETRCYSSRQLPSQHCVKKRIVSVGTEHINQRADFEVWVSKKWTGYITVNLITGAMTNSQGGHLMHPLKTTQACKQMTATVHSILNNAQNANWVGVSSLPSCQNNGVITLYVYKKFSRNYPLTIALNVDVLSQKYIKEEHWDNACAALEQSALCHKSESRCTDDEALRIIDDVPVRRACWQYEDSYNCASAAADECTIAREQGCLQTASKCAKTQNNSCVLYEQTYSCQEKVCPPTVACVKNLFCADGACADIKPTQNEDFGTSIAPLSVAGEAGKEFAATQSTLFAGHPVQCKVWVLDAVDCCTNKGLADKIHLNLCREEDKALAKAKLNYLAHYVGEYCSTKVLGVCTEYKHTYCVFDTKMARIIQEEGRIAQLNPNALGAPESTQCRGLSVNELQQLDMGRINFLNPIYPYGIGAATQGAGIVGDVGLSAQSSNTAIDEVKRRIEQKAAK